MKWFIIILALLVGYAISTGYMGGAQNAAANYNKLLTGKPAVEGKVDTKAEEKK